MSGHERPKWSKVSRSVVARQEGGKARKRQGGAVLSTIQCRWHEARLWRHMRKAEGRQGKLAQAGVNDKRYHKDIQKSEREKERQREREQEKDEKRLQ